MSSMQVKVETLRAHASMWESHASDAQEAAGLIAPAVGRGSDFGWLAGEAGVEESFNAWTEAMDQALADAQRCCRYIAAALTSTANDFDTTDQAVATDMATLDEMI